MTRPRDGGQKDAQDRLGSDAGAVLLDGQARHILGVRSGDRIEIRRPR